MNDYKEACKLLINKEDQYAYLIDLGKELPSLNDEYRRDDLLVKGCASKLYLHLDWKNDKLTFAAGSDSAIISGLLYLIYEEINGKSKKELNSMDLKKVLTDAGLFSLLTAQRQNGLNALITRIHSFIHKK